MKIIKEQSIKTKSGLTLELIRVPAEEGRKIFKRYQGQLLEKYSNNYCQSYCYKLNDGRVVSFGGWEPDDSKIPDIPGLEAVIFSPYDAFVEHMEETDIRKKVMSEFPLVKRLRISDNINIEYTQVDSEVLSENLKNATWLEKTYFQLPNGKILRKGAFSMGTVFRNKADFDEHQKYMRKYHEYAVRKSKGEYDGLLMWNLSGINPYGKKIINHINELSDKLPTLINAPKDIFDFSVNNLFKIDKHLYKNVITYEFQELVFLPLIAYVGEVYLKHNDGKWVVLYDEFNDLWLPDIKQADGTMKMMYHIVYIILNPEEGNGGYWPLKSVYLHTASNPI